MSAASNRRVAVVIPCLNEELTIGRVLDGFRTSLPGADLYVIDNNSSDKTRRWPPEMGAAVFRKLGPGRVLASGRRFGRAKPTSSWRWDGNITYPPKWRDG